MVLTLRAAVLIGSGSTSFEIIRQVSERMPVQTVPTWMNSKVQPIAVVDAITVLVGALIAKVGTRSYDIGGPQRLLYTDLLGHYVAMAGLGRIRVAVPLLPTGLVGTLVGALTDVPTAMVEALVESLRHDMVCAEEQGLSPGPPPSWIPPDGAGRDQPLLAKAVDAMRETAERVRPDSE